MQSVSFSFPIHFVWNANLVIATSKQSRPEELKCGRPSEGVHENIDSLKNYKQQVAEKKSVNQYLTRVKTAGTNEK